MTLLLGWPTSTHCGYYLLLIVAKSTIVVCSLHFPFPALLLLLLNNTTAREPMTRCRCRCRSRPLVLIRRGPPGKEQTAEHSRHHRLGSFPYPYRTANWFSIIVHSTRYETIPCDRQPASKLNRLLKLVVTNNVQQAPTSLLWGNKKPENHVFVEPLSRVSSQRILRVLDTETGRQ